MAGKHDQTSSPSTRFGPNETVASIGRWADETFGVIPGPKASILLSTLKRAEKEWVEVNDALLLVSSDDLAEEIADVCIVLMRGLYAAGYGNSINKKMQINRNRTWIRDGDGHGHHA